MGNIQNKFFSLFSRRKAKQNSKSTQIYTTNSATAQTSPKRILSTDYNDNFALTPALISAIKERLQRDSDLKQAQQWKDDADLPSGLVPYSRPNFEEVDFHPEEQMEEIIEEASLHPTRLTLKKIAEAKRSSNNNNRQFVKVFKDDIETLKPTKATKAPNPKRSRGRSAKKKLLQFSNYQITPGGIRLRNPPSRQLYVNQLTLEGQGKKKKKVKKSSDNSNKKAAKETWVEHLETSHDHDNGSYCSTCFECNPVQRNPVVYGGNVWGNFFYSQAPKNKPEKGILKKKGDTKVLSALSVLGSKGEQQLEQGWKDFGTISNTNDQRSKAKYFTNKNRGKSPNFPHYQNLPEEKIESSAQFSLMKWVTELHERERLKKEQIPRIMSPVKKKQQMVTNYEYYDELDEEEEFDEYARLRSKERKLKRQQEYDNHLAMPR